MSAHKYELMFIADPELDERGLKKLTEQYLELVTKEGGSFDEPDYWGRRKLAYEIAGKTEGNYVVVKYTASSPSWATSLRTPSCALLAAVRPWRASRLLPPREPGIVRPTSSRMVRRCS